MKQEKQALADLRKINKRIDFISGSAYGNRGRAAAYFLLTVLFIACVSVILWLGPEITGFVTFSESVVRTETAGFSVSEPGAVNIKTDIQDINAIMLSGTVYGNGKAAVFLAGPERKHLAYYFEGDAEDGVQFKDMCYDTCHVDGLGNDNTLLFELVGMRIDIDSVKYMYSRIIDFELEPLVVPIYYEEEPAKIIELKLTNRQLTDYSVLLYIDGPLSSSFSWQGSLVHMTPKQPERIIPVTMKLPSNLPKGTYTHKITARYVPPDTYDFVGESPVAETFITVHNE